MKTLTAGPGGRSLFWHLWWAIQKNVGSREPSFSGVITSSLSFPKLVHSQEQVIFRPELPELTVFGFDDLLYGGYLYAAPMGHS